MRSTLSLLILITILLLSTSQNIFCQEKRNISGSFQGYTFTRLVEQLEPSTGYTFYFDPAETDSLLINIQVTNVSLRQLLDQVFKGTRLHYAIDDKGRVFVTNRTTIRTALPPGFFQKNTNTDTTQFLAADDDKPAVNQKLSGSEDNQLFDIGDKTKRSSASRVTIAGYIRDVATGEAIPGAFLNVDTPALSATTDQFGYYSFTLPRGRHTIRITSQGMTPAKRQIILHNEGRLDINLKE